MPTFQFEALNEAGKRQKGTISASDSDDAIQRIRGQGLFPTQVRERKTSARGGKKEAPAAKSAAPAADAGTKKKAKAPKKGAGESKGMSINMPTIGGVSKKILTTFTRQFSTLQDAGLPILRSLQILEQQQKPGLLKRILIQVTEDVASGQTLSDSMSKHPKAFDKLYCKMIAAGEVAGVLDMILQRLAEFMEKAEKLKSKLKSAMIYPTVVISVAGIIVLGIMIMIVPKFRKIFADFDTEMPIVTEKLIAISAWMKGDLTPDQMIPGIVYVIFIPVFVFVAIKLMRKNDALRAVMDTVLLKVPVFGSLVEKSTIARFTRTLGTLIRAGVPILDALNITKDTTSNYVFSSALQKVHDSVRQGESFAEPLRQAKVCDAMVVNMIDVGEETGDLDKMLLKVADNYDEEVDNAVAGMTSLIEPFMVIILGGVVGGIVVALFLPLVKLIQSVS